jgi:3-phosphoshikimate 1-carboxyvinyltransferase
MSCVRISPSQSIIHATIALAASKSESNRALIIHALTGFECQLSNLAAARDTQTMLRLLQSGEEVADVLDAGTTMRFLTAYFALTGQTKIMTGTPRMCERPIGILVEALRTLGAKIDYAQQEGYPPLHLRGFEASGQNQVTVAGNVSSQYISALLMVAPLLPTGLTLQLTGDIGSRPYIEMTIEQMRYFGAEVHTNWQAKTIEVASKPYEPKPYAVESDWSGASYWYSLVALAPNDNAQVELLGLKQNSLQGDSAIVQIMAEMGVKSTFTERGVLLTKTQPQASLTYDFTDCPDLAQTVAVCAAVKGIDLTLTGVESLKIKETDRIAALQAELPKIGGTLVEVSENERYEVKKTAQSQHSGIINTYDDHRMAMAFAPVGVQQAIEISEPHVVAKSYPSFWEHLAQVCNVEK